MGPYEYLIAAKNGDKFEDEYGFRPDFEVEGGYPPTGARFLETGGDYILHDDHDGCVVTNTEVTPPGTNTAIADGLSWGEAYMAGFSLPEPTQGVTYGRDANSTDTGYETDWSANGGASGPTPGGANTNGYFDPEVYVQCVPTTIPMVLPPTGGAVQYEVTVGNEYTIPQTVDMWVDLVYPDGGIQSAVFLREDKTLAPSSTVTRTLSEYIEAENPAGYYRLNVFTGDYPAGEIDQCYFYFLKQRGANGTQAGLVQTETEQCSIGTAPNPFNPSTVVSFELQVASNVNLVVYDIAGRKVADLVDGWRDVGQHEVTFDGSRLASGIYLYRLQAGDFTARGKMVLVK